MAALDSTPGRGKKHKRSAPRIDMTPMVDLAFLLLTFFVMTTTLMKHQEMEIQQPITEEDGSKPINEKKVLNLVLAKNDKVFWYMGRPGSEPATTDFSSAGVRKLLLEKKSSVKGLHVFIKASDQSRYQNMVDILDEIIITDIPNYYLLNLEPEDKKLIN